jgi:hypothetical protein
MPFYGNTLENNKMKTWANDDLYWAFLQAINFLEKCLDKNQNEVIYEKY